MGVEPPQGRRGPGLLSPVGSLGGRVRGQLFPVVPPELCAHASVPPPQTRTASAQRLHINCIDMAEQRSGSRAAAAPGVQGGAMSVRPTAWRRVRPGALGRAGRVQASKVRNPSRQREFWDRWTSSTGWLSGLWRAVCRGAGSSSAVWPAGSPGRRANTCGRHCDPSRGKGDRESEKEEEWRNG
jgi:hypothetical protein